MIIKRAANGLVELLSREEGKGQEGAEGRMNRSRLNEYVSYRTGGPIRWAALLTYLGVALDCAAKGAHP